MAAFARSKHDPVLASGTVVTSASTGSVQFASPFPGQDISVNLSLKGASAPSADQLSYDLDAAKQLITVYAWKSTAAGNTALIAASAAATVDVQVIRQ
jgi:hypothetical protein